MKLLLVAILLLRITISQAQIITDRPDQTESSFTVGSGNFQLESGFLFEYKASPDTRILAPTNLLRYGITNGIELRFVNQLEIKRFKYSGPYDVTFEGISDLEIGTKIRLFRSKNNTTQMAILSHLLLPTGNYGITIDKFVSINKLLISHQFNEKIGLGYNIGYSYFGQNSWDITYSFSLGIGINDRVGIYIEPYGDIIEGNEFIMNFDGGFTYLLNNNLQFDFSYGTSLNKKGNYISIGCSWKANKKE